MGLTITPTTVTVQDEGSSQGAVTAINITGDMFAATVVGNVATINLTPNAFWVAIGGYV